MVFDVQIGRYVYAKSIPFFQSDWLSAITEGARHGVYPPLRRSYSVQINAKRLFLSQPLPFRRTKIPSINMNSNSATTPSTSAISFYEHFLRSPNFLTWLQSRTEATQHTTRARYLHRLESEYFYVPRNFRCLND